MEPYWVPFRLGMVLRFKIKKKKKRGSPIGGAPFFSTKNLSGIEKIGVERC